MEEAERIAREEHGSIKLAVISGKQYLHVVVAGAGRIASSLLFNMAFTNVVPP